MKVRIIAFILFVFAFMSSGLAAQPKIIEMTDSFGNTYNINEERPDYGSISSREGFARATVRESIPVEDGMEFTLCVTEVKADEDDELEFIFPTRDGSDEWSDDKCHAYNRDREDYSNVWHLGANVRNQDDIEVQNNKDFNFQVDYYNLTLGDDSSNTETYEYDTVELSQTEYDRLKQEAESPNIEEDQTIVDVQEYENLQREAEQKESTIQDLNDEVDNKNSKIDEKNTKINEMNSTITELRNKVEELEGGLLNSLRSLL